MHDVPSVPWRPYPALDDIQHIAAARDFFEAVATCRSCRPVAPTPVPREAIEWVIRAAGTAPSGANHQPWHFAIVESAAGKAAIPEHARHRNPLEAIASWI